MIIGVVTGSVIASQHTQNMTGLPLRVVQRVDPTGSISDSYLVAVDVLGAAPGEYVLIASGSTARQTTMTDGKPIDAIIIGIIDTWQIDGKARYEKTSASMTST
ncbi:MAG: EutN/CcmL family microcompartment protein [Chloroflexi bacterium]|nr:EutN/CcmL family microcompartment protein [Chloroflexota bacterium]MCC6891776.1 EutN/CcmL family microcompartment protein [Anaerolineae bacterium]